MRLAVPSMAPGGIDAERSGHFGRCDFFTILNFDDDKKYTGCDIVENPPHVEGGCLAPVNLLAGHEVDAIVVMGIGMRPLMGFKSVGIQVLVSEGGVVSEVRDHFVKGEVGAIQENQVCGGH